MVQHFRQGPFAYVEQCIRAEIDEARVAGIFSARVVDNGHVVGGSGLRDTNYVELLALLKHTQWQARSEALQQLSQMAPGERMLEWLPHAFELAFDDSDARVRGTAWLVLAATSYDADSSAALVALTMRAFIDRFHARAEFHDAIASGARHWLWQLQQEIGRPETEHRAAEARKRYMSSLAGADGARIDALGPGGAATFLEHADPGHRIAALEVLSRAGRGSAEHAARVRQRICSLRPEEAAKLINDPVERQRLNALGDSACDVSLEGECAARVRQIIGADPDPRVRTAAVRTLGCLYAGSGNPDVERFLAEIALDTTRADHTRYTACNAVSTVRGLLYGESPIGRALNRDKERFSSGIKLLAFESVANGEWEADVDWNLIEECARCNRGK